METIQVIDQVLLDGLLERARQSPRRRAIHCLHHGDWEHAHRMLNALTPGTYVRPHRHPDRHNGEGFIVLRGRMAVLIFDDHGVCIPAASHILSTASGRLGMDIAPGAWHSLVALADTVIYEIKGQPAGGYIQNNDKDFAPWAPAEGDPGADAYVRQLERMAGEVKG
ncbi:MAG: WbuC family cupin fold metalloprotein [Blastocatellia bacterium]